MIYRLAKKKNLKAEINVVPYIDVMLVLLIIFMVLSPLLIQGIEVLEGNKVYIRFSGNEKPVVVQGESENYKYLLMPVRASWNKQADLKK